MVRKESAGRTSENVHHHSTVANGKAAARGAAKVGTEGESPGSHFAGLFALVGIAVHGESVVPAVTGANGHGCGLGLVAQFVDGHL
jgi:hypothetical protein